MSESHQSSRDMALDLIDLDRYPIADLDSGAGAAFLAQCQRHMDEHGWCNLSGFLRAEALEQLNGEANDLLPTAETLHVKRNIYQGAIDPSLPKDDHRRMEFVHIAVQLGVQNARQLFPHIDISHRQE